MEVSLRSLTPAILSALVAIMAFGYFTYLYVEQTLGYLEGNPGCLPPYVIVGVEEYRSGNGAFTVRVDNANEDGLRNRSVQSTVNMRTQRGEP